MRAALSPPSASLRVASTRSVHGSSCSGIRAGRPAARSPLHQLPNLAATVPVLGQRGYWSSQGDG